MVQMDIFAGQEQRCRHREGTCGHRGGGAGGMNWESSSDVHTPPAVKQVAGGKLVCSTSSGRCSLLGGIERGAGREVQEGKDIMYTYS